MATDTFMLEREVFLPGHKLTRSIVARVLWKLVGELQPPVRHTQFLSLSPTVSTKEKITPSHSPSQNHASQRIDQPITISYENNNLQNLDSLEYLTTHVKTLRNFSIARNPLKELASIKTLVSLKTGLLELRELITTDTPFREKEIANKGIERYRK